MRISPVTWYQARHRRSRTFRRWEAVIAAIAVVASIGVAVEPALAQIPAPMQSGPPPVIDFNSVGYAYTDALHAFENTAVSQVLATHGLPASDANAVLGWGRNDVRAQEWLDLSRIITEDPTKRSADDTLVYQWFQGVYAQQQIAEAQDAINEYEKWSGGLSLTDTTGDYQNFGPNGTGYCDYSPPGGSTGPFAGTYTGNQDQTCYTPCTSLLGCPINPPTLAQFQAWGAYDELNTQMASADYANTMVNTIAAISMGASMVSAGVTTALAASYGGAGLSTSFIESIFPFATRVAWQAASQIAADGLAAGADAAEVGAAAAAEAAGAVMFVVGVAIFFIVSTVFAILQLVQNAALPGQLQDALTQAQQNTTPDLSGLMGDPNASAGLFATFVAQTTPDVDYSCTSASPDPCADAPTPPAPSPSDAQFLVSTTDPTTGVTTTKPSSTIYTVDQLGPDFINTRMSGNGWFVSTRYNGGDPANWDAPTGTAGATFQSLQFFYTDWTGKHWAAERILDPSGNPEFVVSPADGDSSNPCAGAAAGSDPACVTKTLEVVQPDGVRETVTAVPAATLAPAVAANVPNIVTVGSVSFSATGTDPNNLPLRYSWQLVCPGSTPTAGFACFPGTINPYVWTTGSTAGFTIPSPGKYTLNLTVSDTGGYATTKTFTVNAVSLTTTTVAASAASPTVYGQPVTFTATVNPVNCTCLFSQIPLPPDGYVQFYVDGAPSGAPVLVDLNGGSSPYATATSAPMGDLGVGTHTITARYESGGAYFGTDRWQYGYDVYPGYFGSVGDTTIQVDQATAAVSVTPVYPGWPRQLPVYGQPVSFTATVAGAPPSTGTPTGKVQFYTDGAALGTPVALDATGTATSTSISTLSATGPFLGHAIAAVYSGDAGFQANTGYVNFPDGLEVLAAGTQTSIAASVDPVLAGKPVTYTAAVTVNAPGGGMPAGNVEFLDGGTPISGCTAQPLNGVAQATCTVAGYASAGRHTVTARYLGNTDYVGSTSAAGTETVLYGFGGFITPARATVAAGQTIVVKFTLTDGNGTPIGAGAAAAFAAAGDVQAVLDGVDSGGNAVTVTAACVWDLVNLDFQCNIRTSLTMAPRSGATITAEENAGGGFVPVPVVGSAVNPDLVSFR